MEAVNALSKTAETRKAAELLLSIMHEQGRTINELTETLERMKILLREVSVEPRRRPS